MGKLVLVIGGARSGKSAYAIELSRNAGGKVAFIATAVPGDEEMNARIMLHKRSRPRHWKLIEEGKDCSSALRSLDGKYAVVLIDCLGLLVSNLMAEGLKDKRIAERLKVLAGTALKAGFTTIMVSNDVGSGIVPENALARRFRDLLGIINQLVAEKADEVILMQAGIPVIIKCRGGVGS